MSTWLCCFPVELCQQACKPFLLLPLGCVAAQSVGPTASCAVVEIGHFLVLCWFVMQKGVLQCFGGKLTSWFLFGAPPIEGRNSTMQVTGGAAAMVAPNHVQLQWLCLLMCL
jgi:hypothetical protein